MTEPVEESHTHGAEARMQTPSPEEAERLAEHLRVNEGATNVTVVGSVVVISREPVDKF